MGYASAGLLAGLGKGIESFGKSIEERRAAAIEAARKEASERRMSEQRQAERAESRTWAVEDRVAGDEAAMARLKTTQAGAVEVLEKRNKHDSAESALERANRLALKKLDIGSSITLENLRSRNNVREATALEQWKLEHKDVSVDRYVQDDQGNWKGLAMGRDGIQVIDTGVKGALPAAEGADPLGLPPTTPKPAAPKPTPRNLDKYPGYAETISLLAQTNPELAKNREGLRRAAFEQAQKYQLPTPPDEMDYAKRKGWIK